MKDDSRKLIQERIQVSKEGYADTAIDLAVCKKIVERHSGRSTVQSRSRDARTFKFSLLEKGSIS